MQGRAHPRRQGCLGRPVVLLAMRILALGMSTQVTAPQMALTHLPSHRFAQPGKAQGHKAQHGLANSGDSILISPKCPDRRIGRGSLPAIVSACIRA